MATTADEDAAQDILAPLLDEPTEAPHVRDLTARQRHFLEVMRAPDFMYTHITAAAAVVVDSGPKKQTKRRGGGAHVGRNPFATPFDHRRVPHHFSRAARWRDPTLSETAPGPGRYDGPPGLAFTNRATMGGGVGAKAPTNAYLVPSATSASTSRRRPAAGLGPARIATSSRPSSRRSARSRRAPA